MTDFDRWDAACASVEAWLGIGPCSVRDREAYALWCQAQGCVPCCVAAFGAALVRLGVIVVPIPIPRSDRVVRVHAPDDAEDDAWIQEQDLFASET